MFVYLNYLEIIHFKNSKLKNYVPELILDPYSHSQIISTFSVLVINFFKKQKC